MPTVNTLPQSVKLSLCTASTCATCFTWCGLSCGIERWYRSWVRWCSGYHICFTRRWSRVRSSLGPSGFWSDDSVWEQFWYGFYLFVYSGPCFCSCSCDQKVVKFQCMYLMWQIRLCSGAVLLCFTLFLPFNFICKSSFWKCHYSVRITKQIDESLFVIAKWQYSCKFLCCNSVAAGLPYLTSNLIQLIRCKTSSLLKMMLGLPTKTCTWDHTRMYVFSKATCMKRDHTISQHQKGISHPSLFHTV